MTDRTNKPLISPSHAELCEMFGITPTRTSLIPYAVNLTHIEIHVQTDFGGYFDLRRLSTYGGATQCATCGFGLGTGVGDHELSCPKCGATSLPKEREK